MEELSVRYILNNHPNNACVYCNQPLVLDDDGVLFHTGLYFEELMCEHCKLSYIALDKHQIPTKLKLALENTGCIIAQSDYSIIEEEAFLDYNL